MASLIPLYNLNHEFVEEITLAEAMELRDAEEVTLKTKGRGRNWEVLEAILRHGRHPDAGVKIPPSGITPREMEAYAGATGTPGYQRYVRNKVDAWKLLS